MSTAEAPQVVHAAEMRGGAAWSRVLRRGTALRIRDIEGAANVAALLYNAAAPVERFNAPDTLKAQHTSRLTAPHVLMSDMGRALCSIVHDDCGWHDAIGGLGPARDSLLAELLVLGLGRRDLHPNVNLFSKVVVAEDGGLSFVPRNSYPGAEVVLRAELDTLVVLHVGRHPLDLSPEADPAPVALTVERVSAPGPGDPSRTFREESARALRNTEDHLA